LALGEFPIMINDRRRWHSSPTSWGGVAARDTCGSQISQVHKLWAPYEIQTARQYTQQTQRIDTALKSTLVWSRD
jgi:hypothetical protein